jgi:hypothetical protein
MEQTRHTFWLGVLKFLLSVMAMTFLFPLLGVVAYRPLASLTALFGGGDLLRAILTRALLLVPIAVVSFGAGMLIPRDRPIVRLAAMASVLLFFGDSVGNEIYFALCIAKSTPPYRYIGWLTVQFLLVFLLSYWLSGTLHRAAGALWTHRSAGE